MSLRQHDKDHRRYRDQDRIKVMILTSMGPPPTSLTSKMVLHHEGDNNGCYSSLASFDLWFCDKLSLSNVFYQTARNQITTAVAIMMYLLTDYTENSTGL